MRYNSILLNRLSQSVELTRSAVLAQHQKNSSVVTLYLRGKKLFSPNFALCAPRLCGEYFFFYDLRDL
jgi:hypothetical protein